MYEHLQLHDLSVFFRSVGVQAVSGARMNETLVEASSLASSTASLQTQDSQGADVYLGAVENR